MMPLPIESADAASVRLSVREEARVAVTWRVPAPMLSVPELLPRLVAALMESVPALMVEPPV